MALCLCAAQRRASWGGMRIAVSFRWGALVKRELERLQPPRETKRRSRKGCAFLFLAAAEAVPVHVSPRPPNETKRRCACRPTMRGVVPAQRQRAMRFLLFLRTHEAHKLDTAPMNPPAPLPSDATMSNRLMSLDVFRGATIAAMMLVNNPGDWVAVYKPLLHAEWHGWTLPT